jgi:hypothetical protein
VLKNASSICSDSMFNIASTVHAIISYAYYSFLFDFDKWIFVSRMTDDGWINALSDDKSSHDIPQDLTSFAA